MTIVIYIDVLMTLPCVMCCSFTIVAIGMIVYGFAATGGKPVGLGAVLALVCYPVIGIILITHCNVDELITGLPSISSALFIGEFGSQIDNRCF